MKDAILCVDIGTSSLKAAYMPDSPKALPTRVQTLQKKMIQKLPANGFLP